MSYVNDQFNKLIANKDSVGLVRLIKMYGDLFTPDMKKQLANPQLFASPSAAGTTATGTTATGTGRGITTTASVPNNTSGVSGDSGSSSGSSSGNTGTGVVGSPPWWQDAITADIKNGGSNNTNVLQDLIGDSSAWTDPTNQSTLPTSFLDSQKRAADQKTATALAASKPSFIQNTNAARDLGQSWTQAQQDAQEAGAPVGFVNQAAQTEATRQAQGAVAPAGVDQVQRDRLVTGLQRAASGSTPTLQSAMSAYSGSSDLTAKEEATINNAIQRAIQLGVSSKDIQSNLFGTAARTQTNSLLSNANLVIPNATTGSNDLLFPGISGNKSLFMSDTTSKNQLNPQGVLAIASAVNRFGVNPSQATIIQTGLNQLVSSEVTNTKSEWSRNGLSTGIVPANYQNQILAAINPNDPSLNRGADYQTLINAQQQVTDNIKSETVPGYVSPLASAAQNPLASALAASQSSGISPSTSGAAPLASALSASGTNPAAPASAGTPAAPSSGSDYRAPTAEEMKANPTLWNAKTGAWLGSHDTNDKAYDPVTNPYGLLSTGNKSGSSQTPDRNYAYTVPGTTPDQTSPPIAIYNASTGTWDKSGTDALGNMANLQGMSTLMAELNSGSLNSASANIASGTNIPAFNNVSTPSANKAASVNTGTPAGGTPTGSGVTGDAAPIETGLGSGGPTPGITYSNNGQTTPAPFTLANALTNNMAAQSLSDTYAAQRNFGLNNPDTQGPLGSTTYENIGTQTNPQYKQTNTIGSSQQQALNNTLSGQAGVSSLYGSLPSALYQGLNNSVNASNAAAKSPQVGTYDVLSKENIANTKGNMANPDLPSNLVDPTSVLSKAGNAPTSDTSSLSNVPTGALRTDINDFSGAMTQAQKAAYNNFSNLMEPGYQQDQTRTRSQLINQGLQEGSQAYQTAMDNLSRQQNYARTTAANDAVLTGNQTGLAQQQQLAANQGQLYGQIANTQNQGFTQALNSNNQNFTQQSQALKDALAGQLGVAGQQYSQSQGNFNDLYKALAQQGVTAQNNAQQGATNTGNLVTAASIGAAPITNLSNAIAQLGTPTLPAQTPVNNTGGSNTSLAEAMAQQAQTSLGNRNAAMIQPTGNGTYSPTRYGIDVNGNIFAL